MAKSVRRTTHENRASDTAYSDRSHHDDIVSNHQGALVETVAGGTKTVRDGQNQDLESRLQNVVGLFGPIDGASR